MTEHYDRSADNISNDKIDSTKTKDNYNLAPERNISQMDFINQRCSEVKCLNRKDVNVMASWLITLPKNFQKEDERKFFEESYKFLSERYNENNVISSYVHLDETQPHMHFAFVPVVEDKIKQIEKVSAKECINRKELQVFHKDLDKHMEIAFGYDVGILNQATKEGNKSIIELKRTTAIETLKNASQELSEVQADIFIYQKELDVLNDEITRYENKINAIKEIDGIGKINSLTKKVSLNYDEFEKLKEQAKGYLVLEEKLKNSISKDEYIKFKNQYNDVVDVIRSSDELEKNFKKQYKILKEDKSKGSLEKNIEQVKKEKINLDKNKNVSNKQNKKIDYSR